MIADRWASFVAEVTATFFTFGVLIVTGVLVLSLVWLHGRQRGRFEQARWAVDRRWREAQADVAESAETQPIVELVPAQREPSQ